VENNLLTLKEFAALNGWSPSYVTKLKNNERLVLDGRKVKVKESLELIKLTAGNRSDVAQRHQSGRQKESDADAGDEADKKTLKGAQKVKILAESRRAEAIADKEEMERDRLAGNLIAREDVDAAMKFIGATVRGLMDVFPDQTAPLVAPIQSLDECHSLLSEQCRNVLLSLGNAIEKQQAQLSKEQK